AAAEKLSRQQRGRADIAPDQRCECASSPAAVAASNAVLTPIDFAQASDLFTDEAERVVVAPNIESRDYAESVMMTPGLRKFALTTHITTSVGWFGAVAGFLALAVAGVTN